MTNLQCTICFFLSSLLEPQTVLVAKNWHHSLNLAMSERCVLLQSQKDFRVLQKLSPSVYTWWFLSYALFFTFNHRQWGLTCLWHSWLYSFFHSLLIWPCVVGILETWRFSVEAYCCTVGHGMFNGKDIWMTHIPSIRNTGRSVNLLFFRFFWWD